MALGKSSMNAEPRRLTMLLLLLLPVPTMMMNGSGNDRKRLGLGIAPAHEAVQANRTRTPCSRAIAEASSLCALELSTEPPFSV
jgi:hypothetical protein